ncbi:MAG: PQQ-dependent sugar dehydrogenase, partial [Planctomycetaceae bacterium]|nr:PQQ-dependent sugar dehydrogenase [Planctomycetaceae bacterium]
MRVTLRPTEQPKSGELAQQVERLDDTLRHCRGVLYAHDSLYVSATNSNGFYRLQDLNGDDQFEVVTLLKPMDYRSRYGHGTNQIVAGPDGMVYIVNGNDVSFPEGSADDSPYQNPHNDWMLPWPQDLGQDDRVGHILRMTPDGSQWTVIAGGFRNQVDVAFNPDGELFTWDADMEWDAGTPWYRPTRLNHIVSGGEYGWRWGTGKWPDWFPDSLPTTLDTGLSSPTGLTFATDSQFPEPYRSSLFMADWQNGRILRVTLTPRGASWSATSDLFLEGAPLNVCDITFGPDGAMYFITGGRGSQSGLYRVTWTGTDADLPMPPAAEPVVSETSLAAAREARALRHELERFHGRQVDGAIDTAWPVLGSSDVWLRHAARTAMEFQPAESWRNRAYAESDALTSLTALLALARTDDAAHQPQLLAALQQHLNGDLTTEQLLLALRTLQITLIRQGTPPIDDPSAAGLLVMIRQNLQSRYPAKDLRENWLLCELLIHLQSP